MVPEESGTRDITWEHDSPLDEFLTGERTLRSDVLDRLAATMGLALVSQ